MLIERMSGPTIRLNENGKRVNLHLDVVFRLCRAYDFPIGALIKGWKPVNRIPDAYWTKDHPGLRDYQNEVRKRLRAARLAAGMGTPTAAGYAEIHPSWLVRVELGSYDRLDLIRLRRLAAVYGITLVDILYDSESS